MGFRRSAVWQNELRRMAVGAGGAGIERLVNAGQRLLTYGGFERTLGIVASPHV